MGMFIEILVRDKKFLQAEEALQLIEACPVDIFEPDGESVRINPDQEDECILCDRCVEIAGNNLQIIKLYEADE